MNGRDLIVLAALASAAAPSLATPSAAVERERIARERADVQAAFTKQEAACQDRFVVTPCIEAARKAERDARARLRRQEVLLDEQARKQRAAERAQAIRNNISADETRRRDESSAATASAPVRVERAELAETPARVERARRELPVSERPTDVTARRAAEQEHTERYEADRRAAQAHREAVEQRNAKRTASGKAAAPLPVPQGASAP
jgi:colicin import membrane protein